MWVCWVSLEPTLASESTAVRLRSLESQTQMPNFCESDVDISTSVCVLQCVAVYCNTLQHTATHCNQMSTSRHAYVCCSVLQCVAVYCNTMQHTATHCNQMSTSRHLYLCCSVLQCTATRCNTLQHTAIRCRHLDICMSTSDCKTFCCEFVESHRSRVLHQNFLEFDADRLWAIGSYLLWTNLCVLVKSCRDFTHVRDFTNVWYSEQHLRGTLNQSCVALWTNLVVY